MSWIRRAQPAAECECAPPLWTPTVEYPYPPGHPKQGATYTKALRRRPDGLFGDLWQCDDCGTVWKIGYAPAPAVNTRYQRTRLVQTWIKASPFTQWRYRRRETDLGHIGEGLRTRIADAQKEKP